MKISAKNKNDVDSSIVDSHWQHTSADIFWGEIAPCDHVLQIYETDEIFIDSLAAFVGGGINAEDGCIIIATDAHLKALELKLKGFGVHLESLIAGNSYIPLNAEATLSRFMKNGWPDEALFMKTISDVIKRAGFPKRRIRAFGEMVAILWAQGLNGATVQLEHLWNKLANKHSLSLFCAYPKSGFTTNMNNSFENICCAHSKMINGSHSQLTNVVYTNIASGKAV